MNFNETILLKEIKKTIESISISEKVLIEIKGALIAGINTKHQEHEKEVA